ncbi:AHH domain-containing protein [Photorhabdus kayaii]|nr:AHH domain-containing protein [Photorhabdus kayaii]
MTCHFRFAGQYEDEESGLFYNRHRYYESDTGQYLSPDPLNLSGGFNPYSYVHDPVNWIDSLGLSNSGILDKAMQGQVGDRLSAHHVIPVEVWKENQVFLDKIGIGRQMNSASNGIHIPGSESAMKADVGKGMKVFHSSNHNNYSDEVRGKIRDIRNQYSNNSINEREARDAIRKLQMDMKNKIWSGQVSTTKCGRVN